MGIVIFGVIALAATLLVMGIRTRKGREIADRLKRHLPPPVAIDANGAHTASIFGPKDEVPDGGPTQSPYGYREEPQVKAAKSETNHSCTSGCLLHISVWTEYYGANEADIFTLPFTVGRDKSCKVNINIPRVAPTHMKFEWDQNFIRIVSGAVHNHPRLHKADGSEETFEKILLKGMEEIKIELCSGVYVLVTPGPAYLEVLAKLPPSMTFRIERTQNGLGNTPRLRHLVRKRNPPMTITPRNGFFLIGCEESLDGGDCRGFTIPRAEDPAVGRLHCKLGSDRELGFCVWNLARYEEALRWDDQTMVKKGFAQPLRSGDRLWLGNGVYSIVIDEIFPCCEAVCAQPAASRRKCGNSDDSPTGTYRPVPANR